MLNNVASNLGLKHAIPIQSVSGKKDSYRNEG
jgi:hypothetical protein